MGGVINAKDLSSHRGGCVGLFVTTAGALLVFAAGCGDDSAVGGGGFGAGAQEGGSGAGGSSSAPRTWTKLAEPPTGCRGHVYDEHSDELICFDNEYRQVFELDEEGGEWVKRPGLLEGTISNLDPADPVDLGDGQILGAFTGDLAIYDTGIEACPARWTKLGKVPLVGFTQGIGFDQYFKPRFVRASDGAVYILGVGGGGGEDCAGSDATCCEQEDPTRKFLRLYRWSRTDGLEAVSTDMTSGPLSDGAELYAYDPVTGRLDVAYGGYTMQSTCRTFTGSVCEPCGYSTESVEIDEAWSWLDGASEWSSAVAPPHFVAETYDAASNKLVGFGDVTTGSTADSGSGELQAFDVDAQTWSVVPVEGTKPSANKAWSPTARLIEDRVNGRLFLVDGAELWAFGSRVMAQPAAPSGNCCATQVECSGVCVQTDTDWNHCGGCGNVCDNGSCLDGDCVDVDVVAGFEVNCDNIVADASHIYWLCDSTLLRRSAQPGDDTVEEIATFVQGSVSHDSPIALDDDYLYVMVGFRGQASPNELVRLAKAPGAQPVVLETWPAQDLGFAPWAWNLAVDDSGVFWAAAKPPQPAELFGPFIGKTEHDGSSPLTLYDGGKSGSVPRMILGPEHVYFRPPPTGALRISRVSKEVPSVETFLDWTDGEVSYLGEFLLDQDTFWIYLSGGSLEPSVYGYTEQGVLSTVLPTVGYGNGEAEWFNFAPDVAFGQTLYGCGFGEEEGLWQVSIDDGTFARLRVGGCSKVLRVDGQGVLFTGSGNGRVFRAQGN